MNARPSLADRLARLAAAAIFAMVSLVGCGGDAPTPAAQSASAPSPPAASASVAPATSSPSEGGAGPTATPGASPAPGDRPDLAEASIDLEIVSDALEAPLTVTGAGDGSGRLFVLEQAGRVLVLRDGTLEPDPFLDIRDRVGAGGERGLLGLAFPPGFGVTRDTFYVHYSDRSGDTTVSELRVADGDAAADPASERILLHEEQPYPNHNGGWIGFDADGMLLVALGDGGSGGDPDNQASNLKSPLGKILRIDVLGAPAGEPYAIPPDNPWADDGDVRREILHFGLRNPWRASIDPATGDLWIGDVGQGSWEEVDVARSGARGLYFGWRRMEGTHCYRPSTGCDPAGVTMPVAEYPHSLGCAVTGGVVYRGAAIPALRGAYLFGDYCSGTVWAIDAGLDAAQAPVTLLESGRSISSFGTDDAGEVYVTDLSGAILRVVRGP